MLRLHPAGAHADTDSPHSCLVRSKKLLKHVTQVRTGRKLGSMKKRLQAHPISMRRILQVFAILIVLPLSFGGFLMWMLGLGVDDLTLQTVLLVSIFWFLVSYVPLMYPTSA